MQGHFLKIITDCENPNKSLIILNNQFYSFLIQDFEFVADIKSNINICDMKFVPYTPDMKDFQFSEYIKDFKNILEVYADATPGDTIILLNGKKLDGLIQKFTFKANIENGLKIEVEVVETDKYTIEELQSGNFETTTKDIKEFSTYISKEVE